MCSCIQYFEFSDLKKQTTRPDSMYLYDMYKGRVVVEMVAQIESGLAV